MANLNDARTELYRSVALKLTSPYEMGTLVTCFESQSAINTSSPIFEVRPEFYRGGGLRFVLYGLAHTTGGSTTGGTMSLDLAYTNYPGQWARQNNFAVNNLANNTVSRNAVNKIILIPQYVRISLSHAITGGSISVYFAMSSGRV